MSRNLRESRKYIRLDRSFSVGLHKVGVQTSFEGFTKNISQGGALVLTKDWRAFQKDDQVLLTFYLPPDFTGQDAVIRLLGVGSIRRIDHRNEGVRVQFNKELRQFEIVQWQKLLRKTH